MILRTGRPGRRFVMAGLGPGAESVERPPEIAHRVRDVLRMREGESVELLDGAGRAIEGDLALRAGKAVVTRVRSIQLDAPPEELRLAVPLLKSGNTETAVIAMATLGAGHLGWLDSAEGHNRG